MKGLKKELLKAGVKIDTHESDLFCEKTEKSTEIVKKYKKIDGWNVQEFISNIENTLWYDIPFANVQ